MQTSGQLPADQWIMFNDPADRFKASFPFEPVYMQFNLTTQDLLPGNLDVYSVSWDKGVAMITTLSSSLLKSTLSEEEFKKIFYSCLARRMFFHPRVFKDNQSFKIKKMTIDGIPGLDFSVSYSENNEEHFLKGRACIKDQTLYTIFIISEKEHANAKDFNTFLESFHLAH